MDIYDSSVDKATTFSLIQSFVNAGVDVNCRSQNFASCSALQLAMRYPHEGGKSGEIAECLVGAGANVNCEAVYSGKVYHTPLQYAAKANSVHLVKLFIEHGANVNAEPFLSLWATALQFAAMNGNFEILNILLEAGADINASRSKHEGRTAVEGAADQGRLDMVRYLLEAGANVKGKENGQYRRSVYRAWVKGHGALARMIQDYKIKTYGAEDVCSIEEIVSSMTILELEGYNDDVETDEDVET